MSLLRACSVFSCTATGFAKEIVIPQEKSPGLAALLSLLISGGGQIYNGEIGKGFGIMGGQVLLSGVTLASVASADYDQFPTVGLMAMMGSLVLSGWSIYDAYATAEKINEGAIAKYLNAYIDDQRIGLKLGFEF